MKEIKPSEESISLGNLINKTYIFALTEGEEGLESQQNTRTWTDSEMLLLNNYKPEMHEQRSP